MRTPNLNIVVSAKGVEQVEVLYRPSQRDEAWKLCLDYLPLLLTVVDTENPQETGK